MADKTKVKHPSSVSVAGLQKVEERYCNPKNSMETFVLHGARAELVARNGEHQSLRGNGDSDFEEDTRGDYYGGPEEFDDILEDC